MDWQTVLYKTLDVVYAWERRRRASRFFAGRISQAQFSEFENANAYANPPVRPCGFEYPATFRTRS
jgi:hypothetical protein